MKVLLFLTVLGLICSFCTSSEAPQSEAQTTEHADNTDDINAIFNDQEVNLKEVDEQTNDEEETTTDDNDDDTTTTDDNDDDTDVAATTALNKQLQKNKVVKSQGLLIKLDKHGLLHIIVGGGSKKPSWTTYVHWGKRYCRKGATLLYSGYIGGSHYNHQGDSADYQCMPPIPQYLSTVAPSWVGYLYGTEYMTNNRVFAGTTYRYNAPCAVCKVPKQHQIMIPARVSCPKGFWREYYGYLMTSYHAHRRSGSHLCIDVRPDSFPGSSTFIGGSLLYFVSAVCQSGGGLPCGRYINNRAVTCVVCSKA